MKQPAKVYKYRHFNALTVDSLCNDELFFANPAAFNDPLDCKPHVVVDSDKNELKKLVYKLIQRRSQVETLTSLRLRGKQSDDDKIYAFNFSKKMALQELNTIHYYSTDPFYEEGQEAAELSILTQRIEDELMHEYDRGVCCFSSTFNNQLMWSHYADEHHGICIGYDLNRNPTPALHKVLYGTTRTIKTSLIVKAIINNDQEARSALDQSVLLRKASPWKYEREWRLIGQRGIHESELSLSDVTFGLRCQKSVMYALMKTLEKRNDVRFYRIRRVAESFKLKRHIIDLDDFDSFPHIARSGHELFENLDAHPDDAPDFDEL